MHQESYQHLARRTGVPRSTLADMLTQRSRPGADTVHAVVRAYAPDPDHARLWLHRWQRLQAADPPDPDRPGTGTAPCPRTPAPGTSRPTAPRPGPDHRPAPPPRRTVRHRALLPTLLAALPVLAACTWGWWTLHPPRPATDPDAALTLAVHNVETTCRPLRTQECALGVMDDPWADLVPAHRVTRVWHGDPVVVHCMAQGRPLSDELGMHSDHWYSVTVPTDPRVDGWLPGIRLRVTQDVPTCTTA